jgi:cytochrome c oxidase subunit 3
MFSLLQASEYILSPFSLSDGVMGAIFFIATGFHGIHVLIGTSFLTIVLLKYKKYLNTDSQNIGFECSAWY